MWHRHHSRPFSLQESCAPRIQLHRRPVAVRRQLRPAPHQHRLQPRQALPQRQMLAQVPAPAVLRVQALAVLLVPALVDQWILGSKRFIEEGMNKMTQRSLEEVIKMVPELRPQLEKYANDLLAQTTPQDLREPKEKFDYSHLLGLGLKAPLNPNPRFKNDDDLWE